MTAAPSLYVTDLDGTLLNEHGALSARTRAGLCKLLSEGMPITVASARSHFSIKQLFSDVPFSLPIIEFNGAFLTDYETGEHLETNSIEPDVAREAFDIILGRGQRPFVSSFNGSSDCLHYDELINSGMVWYEGRRRAARDPRLRRTPALRDTLREAVVSLTVMDNDSGAIRALYDEVNEMFGERVQLYCYENEYSPGTWWLTIHDKRASKHFAMQSLRDRFLPGAQIVAFGDNVNDIQMLKAADRAVAVDNALPELHAVADHIIPHHATDSVIAFLEREATKAAI